MATGTISSSKLTATIGSNNNSGPEKVSVSTPSASVSTTFASLTDVSVSGVSDQDLIQFVSSTSKFTAVSSISALTINTLTSSSASITSVSTNLITTPTIKKTTSSDTFTLPASDGTSGQALVTDGSGSLSFSSFEGTLIDATTSDKGKASFSSDNFSVSSGAVSIKDGGVANAELANSSVTVSDGSNTSDISLGGTLTFSGTNNEVEVSESSGTITVGLPNNVTIAGNLTVSGTTTTIDTTNTTIKDKFVELGTGTTGSASGDAGLVIERGDDANAFIGFDESANVFKVGTGSFTGSSTGDLTITTGELVANIDGSNSTLTNIPNSALTNSSITINGSAVSLGGSTSINTSLTLSADSGSNDTFTTGGTLTFTGGEGIDTTVSDDTITIAGEEASTSNKGVASFSSDNFAVSSGAVTIKDGGVANAELANSTVNYGGVSLSLGGSDTTPAFDLSDATNYPTSSLSGTITNAQLAGSIANSKLANSSINFGGVSLALGGSDTTPAFDLSDATNYPTSSLSGTITNAQLAGSIANSKLANSSITINGSAVSLGGSTTISTSLTLAADSGSDDSFSTGSTLTFSGGEGIDTTVSDDEITIAGEDATASNKGIASFSSDDFSVSSGAVTVKSGGITNTQLAGSIANAKLANSSITINGVAIPLGGSVSTGGTESPITIGDDSSNQFDVSLGTSISFLGGSGIDTTVSGPNVTIAGSDASTSAKGVASFSSDDFSVSSGDVTIKSGGVTNTQLAGSIANSKLSNSSITINGSSVSLGGSITVGSDDPITFGDDSSNNFDVSLGDGFSFLGGSGISTAVSGPTVTINVGTGHIIPDVDDAYDLGSADKRWRNLFVGADTINIGGATISSDGSGELSLSASGVTLPTGSKVKDQLGTAKRVSFANDNDQPVIPVPFFSNAGGTGTANAILDMKARDIPVLNFLKSDGTTQGATNMFSF